MSDNKKGWWARLKRPSSHYSVLALLGAGFVGGVVVLGGFLGELQATATESFCVSCHEMRDNVYMEYRNTPHYNSKSGVRATCPDCHLADALLPKVARKAAAIREPDAQGQRHHRYQGEVYGSSSGNGATGLGRDEGQ